MLAVRRVALRTAERRITAAICFGNPRDPEERLWNMAALESYLSGLRSYFGDRATVYFPGGTPTTSSPAHAPYARPVLAPGPGGDYSLP